MKKWVQSKGSSVHKRALFAICNTWDRGKCNNCANDLVLSLQIMYCWVSKMCNITCLLPWVHLYRYVQASGCLHGEIMHAPSLPSPVKYFSFEGDTSMLQKQWEKCLSVWSQYIQSSEPHWPTALTWMRLIVYVEELGMVSPDGPGLPWPRLLDAQVARHIGTSLHFILKP